MDTSHFLLVTPATAKAARAGRNCDDVVGKFDLGALEVFFLADGATGAGFGGDAADAFAKHVRAATAEQLATAKSCAQYLLLADELVSKATRQMGDTTGIIVVTDGQKVWGASAGDSRAVIYSNQKIELTANQRRRPRFGAGAFPIPFENYVGIGDVLVMASDNLWNFSNFTTVEEIVSKPLRPEETARQLEALVCSRSSGQLYDDFSVVVARF